MSAYNRDQADALRLVRDHLAALAPHELDLLRREMAPYLDFRARVARFQEERFAAFCAGRCYTQGLSACCGREGILTFFADVAVNALLSTREESDALLAALARDEGGEDCVYLSGSGCLWRLKPIVCEMFVCDALKERLLARDAALGERWEVFRREELSFTRPTRPVLFDDVERFFLARGCDSPLMYCHRSPGLLRLKAKHGVGDAGARPGAPKIP